VIARCFAVAALAVTLAASPRTNFQATSEAPVVRIQVRRGNVIVKTWAKPAIRIAADGAVAVRRFSARAVAAALSRGSVPISAAAIRTPAGTIALPPEQFALDTADRAPHDGFVVRAMRADAVITVPEKTVLVVVKVGQGSIHLRNYSGQFVVLIHNGIVRLDGVRGSGYVEAARGRVVVRRSVFDGLRARTAAGNLFFQGCTARQIEVSSIDGSILYGRGAFLPGLARFDSENGNVAIGLAPQSSAQVTAHSSAGKIYARLGARATVQRDRTDARFSIGENGPVVTATSVRGAVYLFRTR
jgi:hypothetical protein